jgi:hypothetical protein
LSSTPASGGSPFPLAVGPTGRYLVDRDGSPFLIVGDTAWSLIVSTTRDEARRYLDDRRRRGFNAIIVNLVEQCFSPDPPRTRNGTAPFLVAGTLDQPNDAYFEHAAWVLQEAADRDLLVMLAPAYLGYRDPQWEGYRRHREGWYDDVLATGVEGCEAYGRYLGRRFRSFPNIVWVMSGDRCPGDAREHVRAIVAGLQAEDLPGRLYTAHVNPECRAVEEYPDDPWLTLTQTYSYAIVHRKLLDDYNQQPTRPNVLFETTYENNFNASDVQIRRQAYWAMLSGACGQFFGNTPLWIFSAGWEDQLASRGSVAMGHLRSLFAPRRWWELVPDQDHRLVVDGLGEFTGLDYCAAAITPDGTLAMAYLPTPRTITVDMTQLADRPVRVSWFDPVTGACTPSEPHQAAGRWAFTPPWDHDAVLILDAEGRA